MRAMGQALYRKYRSKSLDEIVGQSHITDMLRRAIKADKIAHAYLLTGPRGVGKTSIARILAHEINQLPYSDESVHLDIIEIDAASNNSVEDIRDLRERVQIAPTSARKKVYIIDEVHMLSKPAFNALLKTLEEPPEHVVFILATTDVDKLPATIISRLQRYNFRTIHPDDATRHLRTIANAERIDIDDAALALIARHGNGSFRDSISLLDQLQHLSDGAIDQTLVEQVLGLADHERLAGLIDAAMAGDLKTLVQILDDSEKRGMSAIILTGQLIHYVSSQVLQRPALLPLLDQLLEVSKSAWPQVKLLTALGSVAPAKKPALDNPAEPIQSTAPTPTNKAAAPADNTAKAAATVAAADPQPSDTQPPATPLTSSTVFVWDDFLSTVRASAPGAAALLAKCGYDSQDDQLTIYAGKKFAKTQLDKAAPALYAALQSTGFTGSLEVVPEPAPPSNSQAAAVLDIMGGGEEVSL